MERGLSSLRSSMRSRDSSSSNLSDPREKIKDCLRKFIAFMFTQVGVGALVVCYAIVGATGFMYIEHQNPDLEIIEIEGRRNLSVLNLWEITQSENIFNESCWNAKADIVLKDLQDAIAAAVHTGYDGRTAKEVWTFPAALLFCLSVITMIGYGNMAPQTDLGKAATIVYASIGIPIYMLYFLNMGKILAHCFKWIYLKLHNCNRKDGLNFENGELVVKRRATVPSTACLWVISFYILCGTIMFGAWEGWNYFDSTYFCIISLCKIGFGDFVPGANKSTSENGSQTKLIVDFIYMLIGMGIIAMCYNLMKEDVKEKIRELRSDLKMCLDELSYKVTSCLNGAKTQPRYSKSIRK